MTPTAQRLGHQPALDGLRAVAIAGVLLAHAHVLVGGHLGVTVFFTLSGFLITTLLVEEHRVRGGISLRAFARRRFARLFPALFAALMATTAAVLISGGHSAELMIWGLLPSLGYVSNLTAIAHGWQHMGVYGWSWSLAIEEQFYVVWPVLCWLVLGRLGGLRVLAVTAAAGVGLATTVRLAITDAATVESHRVYLGTDTRMDGLLVGCLLALWMAGCDRPPRGARWLGLAGFVAVVLLFGVAADVFPLTFTLGLPVTEAATAAMIVAGIHDQSGAVCALLRSRGAQWLGRISYSLYLWNLLPFALYERLTGRSAGYVGSVLIIAVALLVAALSHRWIEQPLRRRICGQATTRVRETSRSTPKRLAGRPEVQT